MSGKRKKIFVVDDNTTNLSACKNILKEFYEVYPAPSAAKMFELMNNVLPDLILLDVTMPDMDGYEAAQILKSNETFRDIPIIFLTAKRDAQSEMTGLSLGAVDYIIKPFLGPLLLKRIETHLAIVAYRKELIRQNAAIHKMLMMKTGQVWQLQYAVLNIVANLVECRDDLTGGHTSRTMKYLDCLIQKLIELDMYSNETCLWNLDFVLPSAQLHDVGKIGISDSILNKQGKLTPGEYEIMKTHVEIGVDAIDNMGRAADDHDFFRHAKIFAGMHHERWDGNGYPKGLRSMEIPLEGRLMAIVDVYDAIVSVRPYKKALPIRDAVTFIQEGSGTQFDPRLVDVFSTVSGQFAEIVASNGA
jgi:putative two-component system response regulator